MKSAIAFALTFFICCSFFTLDSKPTLYLIGDSTVRCGNGTGNDKKWGWGSFIHLFMDTTKIRVKNRALGGTSTRTFLYENRWQHILDSLKKGDIVLIQFGHNDGGMLDDTARARGTIKGIGMDSKEIFNPIRKERQVVYSYGWYLRKYIQEARQKGAIPYICSPVPRNNWTPDKTINRTVKDTYALWAKQVAEQEHVCFIDLHNLIADQYDQVGQARVTNDFFVNEITHASEAGAKLNASIVATELKRPGPCSLGQYVNQP